MTRMRLVEEQKSADSRWMADALCVDFPGLPWTEEAGHAGTRVRSTMRTVCAACPVRHECAAYAVEVGVTAGWWAGRSMHRSSPWQQPVQEPGSDAA